MLLGRPNLEKQSSYDLMCAYNSRALPTQCKRFFVDGLRSKQGREQRPVFCCSADKDLHVADIHVASSVLTLNDEFVSKLFQGASTNIIATLSIK